MNQRDQTHYDLGWDFARFRRSLPEDASQMFQDGYRAFGHGQRRAAKSPDKFERKWLQIRWGAMLRNKSFSQEITPQYIRELLPLSECCPVTQEPFTYCQQEATDWSVERANNDLGYEPFNLILISVRANKVRADLSFDQVRQRALGQVNDSRLTQDQWNRMASLIKPMVVNHDGRMKGVNLLNGQRLAPGTPFLPVARFQSCLSQTAAASLAPQTRYSAALFFDHMSEQLTSCKSQRRAFVRLVKGLIRRARTGADHHSIWSSERVQRLFDTFLSTLCTTATNVDRFLAEVLDKIEAQWDSGAAPSRELPIQDSSISV